MVDPLLLSNFIIIMKTNTIKGVVKRTKQRIGILFTRSEVSSKDKRKTKQKDDKKFFM